MAGERDSSHSKLSLISQMPVHAKVERRGIYFITFTCHGWLPLIELSGGYDAVYDFFRVLGTQGHTILAYVIMPNHIHFLMHFNEGTRLNTVIGNGKKFMAYELVNRLEQKGQKKLLQQLQDAVQPKDRSRGKKHEVWKDSFDVKMCRTEDFILQKLIYIHENPVRGKWRLSANSLEYLHSSARFYFNGTQRLFAVKDYRDFVNWDTMYE